jgi:subtilisin family serine protease
MNAVRPRMAAVVTLLSVSFAFPSNAVAAGGTRTGQARPGHPNSFAHGYKLDSELAKRSLRGDDERTRVIVEWQEGANLPETFRQFARRNGNLRLLNGSVLEVPNALLPALAADPSTFRLHYDRPAFKQDYRTSLTIGARAVQQALGYTGAGVGVAVIDSGIVPWHDDLTSRASTLYPYGNQRVSAFVDFVAGQLAPSDDDGHGTHVAGIIAGNGYDSSGRNAGVAPDADLVVLKVLDGNGNGTISRVIQALDWVLANHDQFNIRVVNLSVSAAVQESYWTDPLTLAAKRLVDAGISVVTAAGNLGHDGNGEPLYGGIGAPANAPWVLTVGASSTNGTTGRDDDTMASFSSRGPTYLDWAAKPDLVAPGVGTVSLAAPGSLLYEMRSDALLAGTVSSIDLPYLSLSGTSMAAPVVTGTIAAMLQANPNLTPNALKAILQYTAQLYPDYDPLTEGAGFLNAVGAIRLARFFATAAPGQTVPTQDMWSRKLIWGNYLLTGGVPVPDSNAFALGTVWGAVTTNAGDNIVWGTACGDACDNIVWGTAAGGGDNIVWGTSRSGDNIVWGTAGGDNIVWGTSCGGGDCDNIVWGTARDGGDNIVWGTAHAGDNIVWGAAGADNIVWGTFNGDNIVWGTTRGDNIVWGTAAGDGDNIVWGTAADVANIVWGTVSGLDNIVWGTGADGAAFLWDESIGMTVDWTTLGGLFPRLSDAQIFDVQAVLTTVPADPSTDGVSPAPEPAPSTDVDPTKTRFAKRRGH